MNYKLSFQELAIIQQRILSKQQPTTLEKAKKQVETLKNLSLKKARNKEANSLNSIKKRKFVCSSKTTFY